MIINDKIQQNNAKGKQKQRIDTIFASESAVVSPSECATMAQAHLCPGVHLRQFDGRIGLSWEWRRNKEEREIERSLGPFSSSPHVLSFPFPFSPILPFSFVLVPPCPLFCSLFIPSHPLSSLHFLPLATTLLPRLPLPPVPTPLCVFLVLLPCAWPGSCLNLTTNNFVRLQQHHHRLRRHKQPLFPLYFSLSSILLSIGITCFALHCIASFLKRPLYPPWSCHT